jgi:hypothetical protein
MVESREVRIKKAIDFSTQIVSNVPDEEMRKVAFGQVLRYLLDQEDTAETGVSQGAFPPSTPPAEKIRKYSRREGPSAWVHGLIEEGFFDQPRVIGEVVVRLSEVGHTLLSKDVSFPLARLCELRKLRRTKSGRDRKGKPSWVYTRY